MMFTDGRFFLYLEIKYTVMNLITSSVRRTSLFLFLYFVILKNPVLAQEDPMPYGKVTYAELNMDRYPQDTSASAFVIKEQGLAYVDRANPNHMIFSYHVKIKILSKQGLEQANIEVLLRKGTSEKQELINIKASTFNIENGSMKETAMDVKKVFLENVNEYLDRKKFTIPNVRVGSVIEYTYQIVNPFFGRNFWPWEFQSNIPKMESEYWAIIPANYKYNISLRGPLELSVNDNEILDDYFHLDNGLIADCTRFKWQMKNIPSFIEEDYMTARKNFIAAIRFELVQVDHFDGRKDKITLEWKDADKELRQSDYFGLQLKRGKDVVDKEIDKIIALETDPLARAKAIFQFIRLYYMWDEYYGMYSKSIKSAFEKRQGDVADINLSLIAALRYAGLSAEPLILSTRNNGLPTDLFPVLSEFNYVICKFNMGEKVYLLDATDDYLSFGVLPKRCLNGKGRVIADDESYWYDLKPIDKNKEVSIINLKLDNQGILSGTHQVSYMGYRSAWKRSVIDDYPNLEEYKKATINKSTRFEVKDIKIENLEDFSKPLVEVQSIQYEMFDEASSHFLFNPILNTDWDENPFKSANRNYPVDFGVPVDESIIINIELPDGIELEEIPTKVAISLPNNGGRFIMDVQKNGNKITIVNSIVISRPLFMPNEYPTLKEFFNRVVKTNNTDLLFRKKV